MRYPIGITTHENIMVEVTARDAAAQAHRELKDARDAIRTRQLQGVIGNAEMRRELRNAQRDYDLKSAALSAFLRCE